MDTVGSILNPTLRIIPSTKFKDYLSKLEFKNDMPETLTSFLPKKRSEMENIFGEEDVTDPDAADIKFENEEESNEEKYLTLFDLKWLHKHLESTKFEGNTIYLHEFMADSNILLPENEIIKRNPQLEARCERLRKNQMNRDYRAMTKNVDNVRVKQPEESIAYQLKSLNKQLIAVFQFVLSVGAGFLFGFLGVKLIIGEMDFGFRLLLGIMCALIIGLAEIYFLAKKLNEELVVNETDQLGGPMSFPKKPHSD